jgi:hypothetical protein
MGLFPASIKNGNGFCAPFIRYFLKIGLKINRFFKKLFLTRNNSMANGASAPLVKYPG